MGHGNYSRTRRGGARTLANYIKKDGVIEWLTAELDKTKNEMKGRNRHLKRYENSTLGKYGCNEAGAPIRAEGLKRFAEENGIKIVDTTR